MQLTRTFKAICSVLLAVAALAGCIATSAQFPTAASTPRLTLDLLKNARYRYPTTDKYVQLVNGIYQEREGFVTPTLMLFEQPLVFTDINADGQEDAVVALDYLAGGSGKFRYLAVVLNRSGVFTNVAMVGLGDRTKIEDIRVQDNIITLNVLTHRMEDGMCCPTLKATWQYEFEDNKLIPLP